MKISCKKAQPIGKKTMADQMVRHGEGY